MSTAPNSEAMFLVYSETTGEYALPLREGWTLSRDAAGRYTAWGAERAAEIMVGGDQCALSVIPAEDAASGVAGESE